MFSKKEAYDYLFHDILKGIDLTSTTDIFGTMTDLSIRKMSMRVLFSSNANAKNSSFLNQLFNPVNETIISCLYDFKPCQIEEFSTSINLLHGVCISFRTNRTLTKPGNLNGLRIDILLEPKRESLISDARGLQMMVHNESYFPTANDGFAINAGVRNSVQVTRTDYTRLGPPYNQCVKEGDKHDSELYNYMINEGLSYSRG